MTKKEQAEIEELKNKELNRALISVWKKTESASLKNFREVLKHEDTQHARLARNLAKYKPVWHTLTVRKRVGTICMLTGTDGGIVATGVAWKAPKDTDISDTGKRIAYSRAVRYLVAKRLGITS